MSKRVPFALVTFLHDLFTVIWIGGMLTLGLIVLPATRKVLGSDEEAKRLMAVVQRRLSPLVYASILGLILTGALLARREPAFQGLLHFGTPYGLVLGIKHLLTVLMVGITVVRSLVLRSAHKPSQQRLKIMLLLSNIALGLLVLLLSGLSVALSST